METAINYTCDTAYFSSDERKWINKIRKLKEEHPDEVHIIAEPENNDGCIYATVPASWMKVSPKIVRNLSDEQRESIRQRLHSKTQ